MTKALNKTSFNQEVFLFCSVKKNELIRHTENFVRETLRNAEGGHDWFHIERVRRNAVLIAKGEDADLLIVELGALLHDIADAKFYEGDETIGPKIAEEFLRSRGADTKLIEHISNIIKYVSFKSSLGDKSENTFDSPELKIIQDADRLDAIGAIGIARAFNYGGFKNRALYDPEIDPVLNMDKESYKKSQAPTINHFYEKLLLLKEMMNTHTGRNLAEERHQFMELFLKQFYQEWEGKR